MNHELERTGHDCQGILPGRTQESRETDNGILTELYIKHLLNASLKGVTTAAPHPMFVRLVKSLEWACLFSEGNKECLYVFLWESIW
jgi:hypothetical protein